MDARDIGDIKYFLSQIADNTAEILKLLKEQKNESN